MEIEQEFLEDLLLKLSDDKLTTVLNDFGIRHHTNVDWNRWGLIEKIVALIGKFGYEEILAKTQKEMTELKNLPYKDYLNSDHWKSISGEHKWIFFRCQICSSSENLNVHHNNYDHIGYECYDDLITLCNDCHAKFHDKLPKGE